MARFLPILMMCFLATCALEKKLVKGPYQWLKLTLTDDVKPQKVVLSKDGQHIYAWAKDHGLFYQSTALAKKGFKLQKLGNFGHMEWFSSSLSGAAVGFGKKLALFSGRNLVWHLDASAPNNLPKLKDKPFIFSKVLMVDGQWTLVFGQGTESPGFIWFKKTEQNTLPLPFKIDLNTRGEFAVKLADNSQNGDLLLLLSFTAKEMVLNERLVNLFIAPILVKSRVSKRDFGKIAPGTVAILPQDDKPWDWGIKNKSQRNVNVQCIGSMLHKGEQHYFAGMGVDGINASMGLAHVQRMQRSYNHESNAFEFGQPAQISFANKSIMGVEVFRDYSLAVTANHGLLGIKSDGTEEPKNNFSLAKFKAPKELWNQDLKVRSIESDAPEDTFLILVEGFGAYLRFRE